MTRGVEVTAGAEEKGPSPWFLGCSETLCEARPWYASMEVDSHPSLLDGDSCGTGRKREGKGLLSAEEEELLLVLLQ
jgi:hypothetical protein